MEGKYHVFVKIDYLFENLKSLKTKRQYFVYNFKKLFLENMKFGISRAVPSLTLKTLALTLNNPKLTLTNHKQTLNEP